MEKVYKPFDIVRLSKSYIEECISQPKMKFPIESILKGDGISTRNSSTRINYETFIGIITETDGHDASVRWFNAAGIQVKCAWFSPEELEVIGNVMVTICNSMAHPFGSNTDQGEYFFGNNVNKK